MTTTKFKCPICGNPTRVIDSRCKTPSITRRRRLCLNPECGHRVSTVERIFIKEEFIPKVVINKGRPPLYLFTTSWPKKSLRVIEAQTKQKAVEIAIENEWTQRANWNLTYLGFPAQKK